MEYFSFDVNIKNKVDDCYPINARSETFGQTEDIRCTSFDDPEFASNCQKLVYGNADTEFLAGFGDLLFNSVFQGSIRDLYRISYGEVARDDQKGIRIRLCIDPPEISAVPWELIHDQTRDCFLATSSETPLTRYINITAPIKELQTDLPIKILVVIPEGSGLEVEKEKRTITKAVQRLGQAVQLKILEGSVTRSVISQALIEEKYQILHYIGHGIFQKDEGYLIINSEGNPSRVDPISSRSFAGFFRDYPSLKLVVLNSCEGAEVSKIKPLAGMAPQLVKLGIPAVIAMQDSIPDVAAVLFATEFYAKLCTGWNAGRVDAAISHARNRMDMDFPGTAAFALPVLFMRSPKGVIFDVDVKKNANSMMPSIQSLHRWKDVQKTYEKNLEILTLIDQEHPGQVADEIENEKKQIAKIQGKIRSYYRTVALVLLASSTICLASYLGFLNFFIHADSWSEAKFLAYMDPFIAKSFNPNISTILKDNLTKPSGPREVAAWRCDHAKLISALTQAQTEVILFDLKFRDPSPRCDQEFGKAISDAFAAGTTVILGADGFSEVQWDVRPVEIPGLTAFLQDNNWAVLRCGSFPKLQLAKKKELPEGIRMQDIPVVPCLALQAIMQSEARSRGTNVKAFLDTKESHVQVKDDNGTILRSIPVGDETMYITVNLPVSDEMNSHDYDHVLDNAQVDPQSLKHFGGPGKIVVVGYQSKEDRQGDRFGVEYEAAAISNILNRDYFLPLPQRYHYMAILVMFVIGFVMRSKLQGWMRLKIPVVISSFINKEFQIPVALLAVIVFYLLLAFILFKLNGIILDFNYHLLAVVAGYLVAGWMQNGLPYKKGGYA